MSVNIITTENLTFCYNSTRVLDDISLGLEKGDYLGIVGPNGSGKSTLIKNILGILPLQTGKVFLFGQSLHEFSRWDKIGYLPQKLSSLNTHFPGSVNEILEMGLRRKNAREKQQVLEMMGIGHLAARLIGELSYGEQQRALLARSLISRPELLIFDEPTTALDPETRDSFYALTEKLNREHGTAVVLVTHDVGIIGKFARRMLYLDKKIIFTGTFEDFCASSEMTGFFGSGSQHIICHQHDTAKRNG
ncbi:MAG TPA: metal ABC transporter ATP-binding protein [Smithellaceae bacterium]|nr:metal ABC transporter ATP-binding protein [Smithellaceae bacterium]HRS89027.1 metal ABC transporter ATP-binding protein [Smithellaceae bacterium]HRV25101.1 metal ABC transporter ATP-binding protein [Smithellaceae bacterium]